MNWRVKIFGIIIGGAFVLFAAGGLLEVFCDCQTLGKFAVIGMSVTSLAVFLVGGANSILLKEMFDDDYRDGGKIGRIGFIFLVLGQFLDWYLIFSSETPIERFSRPISIGVCAMNVVGWLVLLLSVIRIRRNMRPWAAFCGIVATVAAALHAAVPSCIAPVVAAAIYAAAMLAGTAGFVSIVRER